jgi:hypothetical protein
MQDDRDRITGKLDDALPDREHAGVSGQPLADTARAAGLEPGRGASAGADREITGELDKAVDAPDHNQLEEAPLPGRGR